MQLFRMSPATLGPEASRPVPDLPDPTECLTAAELGALARELRGDASQREVADLIGVHQSHVSRAEKGESAYSSVARQAIEHFTGRELVGPLYRLAEASADQNP